MRPDGLTRGGIGAGGDAFIADHVDQPVDQDRRSCLGDALLDSPLNVVGFGDVARAVDADGPQFGPHQAGDEVSCAVLIERPGSDGPVVVVDTPYLFTGAR